MTGSRSSVERLLDASRYCWHWGTKGTLLIQMITPTDRMSRVNELARATKTLIQESEYWNKRVDEYNGLALDGIYGLALPSNEVQNFSRYIQEASELLLDSPRFGLRR